MTGSGASRLDTAAALKSAHGVARDARRSAASVKVEIIRDLAAVAVDALDDRSQSSLFDRIDWFRRTWAHCPPGRTPIIARATTGRGAAWLFLAQGAPHRAVALASWYTLAYRPVFTGDPDTATQSQMLTALARSLRAEVGRITLEHVPADTAAQLAQSFAPAHWLAVRTPQVAHWTVDVAGKSFAQYWTERPGQLRSTVKRKAAKTALAIAILDRFDEAAWADYAAVYADSWKPDEGSLPFLHAMAQAEGTAGRLRLGLARADGHAIAAQLWTVDHGIAIIHKLAHRSGSDALSPGTILSKALFEHVIDRDRVDKIDFGTGDDRYKADWMNDRAMLERVELYNLTDPHGLAGATRAKAGLLVDRLRAR